MDLDLLHPSEQGPDLHGRHCPRPRRLSIQDETSDTWITPKGVDKGMLTAKDIVRVGADGAIRRSRS
jgi:ribulose-5-phosphate 4-epimerase/fuculose-1-phosphate aldolase